MKVPLQLHPDYLCPSVARIEAWVDRIPESGLVLGFKAYGDIAALRLPSATEPQRLDDLWKHTCFEAFVRPQAQSGYREINIAPSGDWASYGFSDYRAGMVKAGVDPPKVSVTQSAEMLELKITITLDLPPTPAWHVGLSAVIEEANGNKSYWALRHAPGKADFHLDDGFALLLPGL